MLFFSRDVFFFCETSSTNIKMSFISLSVRALTTVLFSEVSFLKQSSRYRNVLTVAKKYSFPKKESRLAEDVLTIWRCPASPRVLVSSCPRVLVLKVGSSQRWSSRNSPSVDLIRPSGLWDLCFSPSPSCWRGGRPPTMPCSSRVTADTPPGSEGRGGAFNKRLSSIINTSTRLFIRVSDPPRSDPRRAQRRAVRGVQQRPVEFRACRRTGGANQSWRGPPLHRHFEGLVWLSFCSDLAALLSRWILSTQRAKHSGPLIFILNRYLTNTTFIAEINHLTTTSERIQGFKEFLQHLI